MSGPWSTEYRRSPRTALAALSGFLFFFSSRRRHTRLQGDWSSDVCSSDLSAQRGTGYLPDHPLRRHRGGPGPTVPGTQRNYLGDQKMTSTTQPIRGCPSTTGNERQLNTTTLIRHAARTHGDQEIVYRTPDGGWDRYTYADCYRSEEHTSELQSPC